MSYKFHTIDSPQREGAPPPSDGDTVYPVWFPLDEGGELVVFMGRQGLINTMAGGIALMRDDPALGADVMAAANEVIVEENDNSPDLYDLYKRFNAEVAARDAPRLVITYKRDKGMDTFDWGVTNKEVIPLMKLVGAVRRAGAVLATQGAGGRSLFHPCPEPALCIAWEADGGFGYYAHHTLPVEGMLGTLCVVESYLMGVLTMQMSQAAQQARQGGRMLGPDGRPFGG